MTVFLGTVFTQWGLQAVTLQVVALEQPLEPSEEGVAAPGPLAPGPRIF